MKIKKESSNLGNCWTMVILDDAGREVARHRHAEKDIDSAIRRLRCAIRKHIDNGGTLGNYQF